MSDKLTEEEAEVILERVMALAELLTRRSAETQSQRTDDQQKSGEKHTRCNLLYSEVAREEQR